jgi:hypothetical protein
MPTGLGIYITRLGLMEDELNEMVSTLLTVLSCACVRLLLFNMYVAVIGSSVKCWHFLGAGSGLNWHLHRT